MNLDLNNPLVTNVLALVAVVSSLWWLWMRLTDGSSLLPGLIWLVTVLLFGWIQITKTRSR